MKSTHAACDVDGGLYSATKSCCEGPAPEPQSTSPAPHDTRSGAPSKM